MSSDSGIEASTACVYYPASKFAPEALSEGLASELHSDWNIKVTILEPGPIRTKRFIANAIIGPVRPAYTDPELSTMQLRGLLSNTDCV
ncbi:hypothetical protein PAXINDRAFT_18768 [Paxillus involutus ATCC 200175]|uniref:Uncharacterized protein n=1 Tax=Paxillus involutus ATCC 200175 TaxID=664439 RepID=A0A0C9SNK2_PAXIN|nr:hypothetical protein PAXINDRAFT_18768 [Paxillus involutus ATCC 200175]